MKAGDVLLGGDYAERIERGEDDLPDEALNGCYKLGTVIMVAKASMSAVYVLPNIPDWFPAQVCLPPPVPGQWYRWYDPFIWYETEQPIHVPSEGAPVNMSYVGKLWNDSYYRDNREQWAYPLEEWRRLFEDARDE